MFLRLYHSVLIFVACLGKVDSWRYVFVLPPFSTSLPLVVSMATCLPPLIHHFARLRILKTSIWRMPVLFWNPSRYNRKKKTNQNKSTGLDETCGGFTRNEV